MHAFRANSVQGLFFVVVVVPFSSFLEIHFELQHIYKDMKSFSPPLPSGYFETADCWLLAVSHLLNFARCYALLTILLELAIEKIRLYYYILHFIIKVKYHRFVHLNNSISKHHICNFLFNFWPKPPIEMWCRCSEPTQWCRVVRSNSLTSEIYELNYIKYIVLVDEVKLNRSATSTTIACPQSISVANRWNITFIQWQNDNWKW